jgi:hypothetical protein
MAKGENRKLETRKKIIQIYIGILSYLMCNKNELLSI